MRKLSDYKLLSEMSNGETLKRPVYVNEISDKENKAGKMQVNLQVRDGSGPTNETVTIFDADKPSLTARYPFLKEGSTIILTITLKDPYFNASNIIEQSEEEYDFNEIAETATDKSEECFDYILKTVKKASDERNNSQYDPLCKLVEQVYMARKVELIRGSSAAANHHTGISGNILHTAEVVNLCDMATRTCIGKNVDRELLLAGAALHDVGKTTCYSTNEIGSAALTLEGYAYGGHHLDSIRAVEEAEKMGNYDKERLLLLKNMIASHHGAREYGDIASPMTIEAYWLSAMDDLDAKHYEAKKIIEDLEPGEVSEKKYPLKVNLYRRTDQVFK